MLIRNLLEVYIFCKIKFFFRLFINYKGKKVLMIERYDGYYFD